MHVVSADTFIGLMRSENLNNLDCQRTIINAYFMSGSMYISVGIVYYSLIDMS